MNKIGILVSIRSKRGYKNMTDGHVTVNRQEAEKENHSAYSRLFARNAEEKHPRTVIGQYKNGDYMVFTCGGRETNQAGMTMHEINDILVSEGLKYAYNLDGGGSSTMLTQKPGDQDVSLTNKPTEGFERTVSTSLIFPDWDNGLICVTGLVSDIWRSIISLPNGVRLPVPR